MRNCIGRFAPAVVTYVCLTVAATPAAEPKTIQVKADGDGSAVTITAPEGFGRWFLHFPETMLLEGPVQGKAKMTRRDGADGTIVLEGRMEGDLAHSIRITYKPGVDTIDLTLEVTNLSKRKWGYGGEAMACLRPLESPDLVGEVGKRTLVFYQGKLRDVATIGQELGRPVGPTTTVSHPVRGEQMAPKQVQYHQGSPPLDDGVIVRRSPDGKRLVAFAWDRVHRVSMNFTHSCLHSNPRVTDLEPGAGCRRTGRIYFLSTGAEEFWKRYRKDFPERPRAGH